MLPTEIIYKADSKAAIAQILNKRYAEGWILERIIDHGIPTENAHGDYLIYYFKKECST